MLCEWFINYLLPLFCEVDLLTIEQLAHIRYIFALAVTLCGISLLIVLPYKWIRYLLSGGRRKKV